MPHKWYSDNHIIGNGRSQRQAHTHLVVTLPICLLRTSSAIIVFWWTLSRILISSHSYYIFTISNKSMHLIFPKLLCHYFSNVIFLIFLLMCSFISYYVWVRLDPCFKASSRKQNILFKSASPEIYMYYSTLKLFSSQTVVQNLFNFSMFKCLCQPAHKPGLHSFLLY